MSIHFAYQRPVSLNNWQNPTLPQSLSGSNKQIETWCAPYPSSTEDPPLALRFPLVDPRLHRTIPSSRSSPTKLSRIFYRDQAERVSPHQSWGSFTEIVLVCTNVVIPQRPESRDTHSSCSRSLRHPHNTWRTVTRMVDRPGDSVPRADLSLAGIHMSRPGTSDGSTHGEPGGRGQHDNGHPQLPFTILQPFQEIHPWHQSRRSPPSVVNRAYSHFLPPLIRPRIPTN